MLAFKYRLKNRREFEKTYQEGRFFSIGPISLKSSKNNLSHSRFGLAVGKKFSKKAFERNRAKRVLRACIKQLLPSIKPGYDTIIMLYPQTEPLSAKNVLPLMTKLFRKANLLK